MPQSARGLWPPGLLRHPPIDAFQQVTELRWRERHHPGQAHGPGRHARAPPAVSPAEYEQMPAVWITLERPLHQKRQAIKALACVGVAGRQPNPSLRPGRGYRRRLSFASAFNSAAIVDAATASQHPKWQRICGTKKAMLARLRPASGLSDQFMDVYHVQANG
jgi:hypothetical protein